MTTSRGVTIMKNVTSGTSGYDERRFTDLLAALDGQPRVLENPVDDFGRVERVDGRHIRRLGYQVLPALGRGWIDVVHHRVAAPFEGSGKVVGVQPDHAQLQFDERVGREHQVEPALA